MNERPNYVDLFRRIASGICYRPSEITVRPVYKPGRIYFFVDVNPNDAGILCGKNCAIIKAIQLIFRGISARFDEQVHISVDGKGERTQMLDMFKEKDTWDKTPVALEIISDIVTMSGYSDPEFETGENHDATLITVTGKIPAQLWDALEIVMTAWGKSQGRRIVLATPEQANA